MEFESSVWVPALPAEVFAAVADPRRLDALTPPWIRFRVADGAPRELRVGSLVDYRLTWHGLPMRWQSRIREWRPPAGLVYEQARGPFRHFVHEQLYREADGGTLAVDRLDYSVLGGRPLARLLVEPDLARLFAYRAERLAATFGAEPRPPQRPRVADSSSST